MIESLGRIPHPAAAIADLRSRPAGSCIRLQFALSQYWLTGSPEIELHALCFVDGGDLLCLVTDNGEKMTAAVRRLPRVDGPALEQIAAELDASVIDLNRPLVLNTVRIAKPWGAEIWYTGVEQRGVCRVGKTPLPWLVALTGELCCGAAPETLILLKILDPLPDPVYGDLYFEMHEQKVEVYVVTHVDESAWPEGTGAIRFGFDPDKLGSFASIESFKEAWLDSVAAYREVRTAIDRIFDEFRETEGIGANDVISTELAEQWKLRLDEDLNALEQQSRDAMNAFTCLQPLRPGDVVRVPPFTPHSLQHGVRVVEFQTPHYERYILSFAQKVLTQAHWDTIEVIEKIDWQARFDSEFETLESGELHRVDRIANFDEFEVRRVHLQAGVHYRLAISTYVITMAIEAPVNVCGLVLAPEQACLVPAILPAVEVSAAEDGECFALLAIPRTSG